MNQVNGSPFRWPSATRHLGALFQMTKIPWPSKFVRMSVMEQVFAGFNARPLVAHLKIGWIGLSLSCIDSDIWPGSEQEYHLFRSRSEERMVDGYSSAYQEPLERFCVVCTLLHLHCRGNLDRSDSRLGTSATCGWYWLSDHNIHLQIFYDHFW